MKNIRLGSWFKGQSWISKSLLITFLLSLTATFCTFLIADKVHTNFYIEQDKMINKITEIIKDKKILTQQETGQIERMVQSHKERYPTYRYFALYLKENHISNKDIASINPKNSKYSYPEQAKKKVGIMADVFFVSEALEAGDWYIIHQYHPTGGYYYEITVLLASISGISLIIWLFLQVRYLLWIRQLKHT
ncbi:hypothetical protein [Bacillus cereus]|uniref:hypothetical protein n=1 Tax=Bacillus cereus TaxID=1396 RepID=UPI000777AD8A|nr:hypothetical protein [Bacillus cereus]UUE91724.1 hypothetical protein L2I54_27635 [Bacillus cereus]HDX9637709.1 hypothetical protein [Bacillus cereus]